ncbi:MAG TPA: carotenoid oxygenase family protein [Sandaracinaceae bacterium LLY-WYZ-13_1]|nr:carotenoid oxygenase family protein [Sandaracinaceae bacterium LLY-WYZ-13_1]
MLHPRVPRSVLRTDRTEHTDLPLHVEEGALPDDLEGHLFVVAPASTPDPEPVGRRTTLMVGDGLVCRFDLRGDGVTLTSRLARTPDFLADELTASDPTLKRFRFVDAGLARVGLLGARDLANTAFVPMRAEGSDAPTRLLLTFDAGRPVEIDPLSLAVVTPVGGRTEWRPEALGELLFPLVLSPAHPAWDGRTGELFTLNYGRGVGNFAATIPIVHLLSRMPSWLEAAFDRVARVVGVEAAYRWLVKRLERVSTRVDRELERLTDRYLPFVPDTFTDLVRWNGAGPLERWRLVLPDDEEVRIQQSVHQVAVTREHVVILETGFKIGLQSGFNDPVPHTDSVDRLMRALLTRPQLPYTAFYVVSRADLSTPLPPGDDGVPRVRCRRVQVPLEADHFLADYDDADGRITLHVAHAPATDLSEWVRPYDRSAYDDQPVDPALVGMLAVGAMDVGRFGRYVVDAATGDVLEAETLRDDETSWAIALYAGRALNTPDALPERIEQLYWCTEGCFPELLTDFVFHLYEPYEHRATPVSEILAMARGGRPSAVIRLDAARPAIADAYPLPTGVMAGSLQYVPRGEGPTEGYLIGTVYTDARTELWIFDAADLARGPVCKLAADGWRVGFSLHTAWLPRLAPRRDDYTIDARAEWEAALSSLDGEDGARLREALRVRLYPS